eukprot:TRINITY_DN9820_c0_g1_i1.p1 TRINITY_DN9820_c0_g1~~TRINITY_DN9820_c0_g1_i1.p1  ORF type:complete len:135 (-),score=33.65 TRINITY_DN9820_c0_g1_i1:373-777(-)
MSLDDVLNLEERYLDEGFTAGLDAGAQLGLEEGSALGFSKGWDIGSEIGYFTGCARLWKALLIQSPQRLLAPQTIPSRFEKQLSKFQEQLQSLPSMDNPQNEQLFEMLAELRAKHKQLCSLIKMPTNKPNELSF